MLDKTTNPMYNPLGLSLDISQGGFGSYGTFFILIFRHTGQEAEFLMVRYLLSFMVALTSRLLMSAIKGCFGALTEVTYSTILHLGIFCRKTL